jgi:hypothetical protein
MAHDLRVCVCLCVRASDCWDLPRELVTRVLELTARASGLLAHAISTCRGRGDPALNYFSRYKNVCNMYTFPRNQILLGKVGKIHTWNGQQGICTYLHTESQPDDNVEVCRDVAPINTAILIADRRICYANSFAVEARKIWNCVSVVQYWGVLEQIFPLVVNVV